MLFAKDASTDCRKRALARGLLSKVWVRKDAAPEGAYCGFRPVDALHKRISTGVRDHAGKARTQQINFVRHPRLPSVLSPGGTCPWVADNHGGLEITITMM